MTPQSVKNSIAVLSPRPVAAVSAKTPRHPDAGMAHRGHFAEQLNHADVAGLRVIDYLDQKG